MNLLLSRRVALVVLLFTVAGCSTVKDAKDSVTGWFNGNGNDSVLNTETGKKTTGGGTGPTLKYAATLRVGKYVDQRKLNNPRQLGITTQRVRGVDGRELLLDQEIANIVTTAIKMRFDKEGYQVLEGSGARDHARRVVEQHRQLAMRELGSAPVSEGVTELMGILDFVLGQSVLNEDGSRP